MPGSPKTRRVACIVPGALALKRARMQGGRAMCYLLALATFAWIVSVAIKHDPRSVFVLRTGQGG